MRRSAWTNYLVGCNGLNGLILIHHHLGKIMGNESQNIDAYKGKTDRLNAWSRIGAVLVKLLWAFIIIIILASLGKMFLLPNEQSTTSKEGVISQPLDYSKLDTALRSSMIDAREVAKGAASKELDGWVDGLMEQVDNNFLDWYFGYLHQQKIGLKSLLYGMRHWVNSKSTSAAEKATEDFQLEFSNRVLRPEISQKQLEQITDNAVRNYIGTLSQMLNEVPEKYDIPQGDWTEYLDNASSLGSKVNGNRDIDLTLKTIASSTAAGTVAAIKVAGPAVKSIASKASVSLTGKAAGAMAAKTGGKVAAKAGGKLLGPIVGIGIILWDVWDQNQTKNTNKPILRENLHAYLKLEKNTLLDAPQGSVMSAIDSIDKNLVAQLK